MSIDNLQKKMEEVMKVMGVDSAQLTWAKLDDGITNKSFVVSHGKPIVVRFPGDSRVLGIDRDVEIVAMRRASEERYGPEVLFDDWPNWVALEFIEGDTLYEGENLSHDDMRRVAEVFKKLHGGEKFGHDVDIFNLLTAFSTDALERCEEDSIWRRYPRIFDKLSAHVKSTQLASVPSHCDPGPKNWIRGEKSLYLLDWETAGDSTPLHDLANFSAKMRIIDSDLQDLLLGHYFDDCQVGSDLKMGFYAMLLAELLLEGYWSIAYDTREERFKRVESIELHVQVILNHKLEILI